MKMCYIIMTKISILEFEMIYVKFYYAKINCSVEQTKFIIYLQNN